MRRPAQHPRPAAPGWTRPYAGLAGLAVFYNDGGDGGGQSVPSPADLANRAPQQPATTPPADGQPRNETVLLDHRTGQPMTQEAFAKIMARENAKGRRAALRELAENAGVPLTGGVSSDPDDADVTRLAQVLKDAEAARQAQLSEDQRRAEELAAREKALADREAQAAQQAAETARRDRETRIRSALVSLGATGDDLEDAARLLTIPDDATDEQITQAATQLKERRGVLFGQSAPQTLPPAPSGGPAGGNTPRQPASTKDAVREAARKRAIERGLRAPDAA